MNLDARTKDAEFRRQAMLAEAEIGYCARSAGPDTSGAAIESAEASPCKRGRVGPN